MTRRERLMDRYSCRRWPLAAAAIVPLAVSLSSVLADVAPADPAAPHQSVGAGPAEDEMKELIVMLRVTLADQLHHGAGIIVGQGSDRVYIVTANHVVRQGLQHADRVEAQFRWLPGEWREARLLSHADVDLDVAMLAVTPLAELAVPDLAWSALGDPRALQAGAKLFPVGFPNDMAWFRPQQPHVVHSVSAQHIRTEGQVYPGNSGGALVTEEWRVVGVVSNVSSILVASSRIDLILGRLTEWGYPVDLSPATAPDKQTMDSGKATEDESVFGTCSVAGVVLDAATRRPTPVTGMSIGFVARDSGAQPAVLEAGVTTGRDGTFSISCPRRTPVDRFPLELVVWQVPSRIQRTKIEVRAGDMRADVEVRVRVERLPTDDCISIDPSRLLVEYHEGRGGWRVVADTRGAGQVLPPEFEANESGARAVARLLQVHGATEYCQLGGPPAVFYFLARGVPLRGFPTRDQCRSFDPTALLIAEPDRATGRDWSVRHHGEIILRVRNEGLGRSALATIQRQGFTAVCYPGRPMAYLR